MRRSLYTLVVLFGLATSALFAQSFTYPNFASVAGLTLNTHAVQATNASAMQVLRVTPSLISQRGTAFAALPVNVAAGFETTFAFQVTTLSGGGADGLCFIVHADPRLDIAIGNHAAAMAYGAFPTSPAGTAIANSLVVEFDTFTGSLGGFADLPGSNEISIHTGGSGDNSQSEGFSLGRIAAPTSIKNGTVHTVRIRYIPGTLQVFFNNLVTPVLTVPYDFSLGGTHFLPNTPVGGLNLLGGSAAIIGFGASTGGSWENHDVLSWTFTSFEDCLAGQSGDIVSVNAMGGAPSRSVSVALNSPFAIGVALPAATLGASANFALFVDLAGPAVGAGFPTPFGTLCFTPPVLGLPSLALTLFDSFGFLGPALLPATPAPFSFAFPGGIGFPATFTLHGLVELNPGIFAITNGVVLRIA